MAKETHDAIGWRDGEVAFGPLFTRPPREAAGDHSEWLAAATP